MNHKPVLLTHARCITPDRILQDSWLLLADGRIRASGQGSWPEPDICGIAAADCQILDLAGSFLTPGFIDIHTHGAGGSDFMDGTADAWKTIARTHARHGTTALLATTCACLPAELEQVLQVWEQWQTGPDPADPVTAAILGLHLEGPYFAQEQRGAQDPLYIRNPDPAEYRSLIERCPGIRRWSTAPELPGALEFGAYAASRGILVSIAHSNAIYAEVLAALDNGYSLATHLYSGMSGVTRLKGFRRGGVIESALLLDSLDVEIIADGCHLPPELLRLIYKCKGPGHIALITDSMRAAGQDVSTSIMGSLKQGQTVLIRDGVACLPDLSAFAGSIATTDRLLQTLYFMAGISLPDAVAMLTYTPARLLRIQDRKGGLKSGMDADLAVLDQDLQVIQAFVGGRPVIC
ncbi:MAG TPA: N-acetylglucosamine-6-phosphate deacetylase [Clostridiales bacterium]|nr:N-acetylglucosamine-6-phosphate deacetylase [Clostridiales bacterium]